MSLEKFSINLFSGGTIYTLLLAFLCETTTTMASLKIQQIADDDEAGRILHNEITHEFQKRYVAYGEDGTCMPEHYVRFANSIENFEVQDSDVWVCSYPKAGTTWTQEMVWLIANNLDFKGAETPLPLRFPFLELCTIFDSEIMEKVLGEKISETMANSVEFVKKQESPRFIKCHLPFPLLPKEIRNGSKTPKIVCVMRNPKDVCVSYYHHCKLLIGCGANLENFSKAFLADKVLYGSYWKHVNGFWEKNNLENLLIIKYEDMKKDLPGVIRKVADFLNKTVTDEQVVRLTEHLSFESMKNNNAVNYEYVVQDRRKKNLALEDGTFMRSGTVGSYKEELSPEIIDKFDAWIKQNINGTSFDEEL